MNRMKNASSPVRCESSTSVGMSATMRAPMALLGETTGIQFRSPATILRGLEGSPAHFPRSNEGIRREGSPESITKPLLATSSTGVPEKLEN